MLTLQSGRCFASLVYLQVTKTSELPNLMPFYRPLLPLELPVLASKTWLSLGVLTSSQASVKLPHSFWPRKVSLHTGVALLNCPNPLLLLATLRWNTALFMFQTCFSCLLGPPWCDDSGTWDCRHPTSKLPFLSRLVFLYALSELVSLTYLQKPIP